MSERASQLSQKLGSLSSPFIRRPIGTSLLAAGLFVLGAVCYVMLGVAPLPNVTFPAIFVIAHQPGADAGTMASTVAAPLERHLGQIAGVDTLTSSSRESAATVIMLFDPEVDIDDAAREVQAAINASAPDLPAGLSSAPTYHKANPNDQPVLILAVTSRTHPLSEVYNLADSLLAQRIRQLPGVADVDLAGGATPAIRVDLDLRALSARGLSVDQVRSALNAANVTAPTGFLSNGHTTMAIAANDALHTADEFADVVIAVQNGVPVRLRDVAVVADGQEDRYQAAWFNRDRSILMLIRKTADANVVETVDRIQALVPELRSWLPAGMELLPFQDRTPTIRASVHHVQITLAISLSLVMLTMLLFLRRLAPTLIAGAAVPLSLAGAFVCMYVAGSTLNSITLMALVIAIGFVVDDAIVVIENIIRHLDAGMPRLQATLLGAREIGFTVVSITASLVAVFIPMLFAGGFIGGILREFALTLTSAIVVSAVVSLTVTASLCGLYLKPHREPARRSRLDEKLEAFHTGMLDTYRRALDWSLRHPRSMAIQPVILIGVTIWLFVLVPKGFYPEEDTGQLQGSVEAAPGVSFRVLAEGQQQVVDILLADPAVESIGSRIGGGWDTTSSSGRLFVNLKQLGKGRDDSTAVVMRRLLDATKHFTAFRVRLRPVQDAGGGGSGGAQYTYALKGPDLAALREWAPRLVNELRKLPQLRDVSTDLQDAAPRQNLVIDRDAAARLGVRIAAIDSALYDAFGQRQISTIYSDINQYKVVVTALPQQSTSPESLTRLFVRSQSGAMVPISALARMENGIAPNALEHDAQFPVMNISFNLAPDVPMSDAAQLIEGTMKNMRMPGDIRAEFGGDFLRFQQQQSDTPLLILTALVAVYLILGILYESLIHPVTILSTLPSAGVGALLALLITDTELSIVSVIAIVLLIGIVKKNAIMMIDFALEAERSGGKPPLDAIREACLVRFRPIMMTSMVAILGSLPLALDFGTGGETRRPLGIAMVGGLLASQLITLLTTPAIYLLLARRAQRRRERRAARRLALQ